jgi:hypothetical protein
MSTKIPLEQKSSNRSSIIALGQGLDDLTVFDSDSIDDTLFFIPIWRTAPFLAAFRTTCSRAFPFSPPDVLRDESTSGHPISAYKGLADEDLGHGIVTESGMWLEITKDVPTRQKKGSEFVSMISQIVAPLTIFFGEGDRDSVKVIIPTVKALDTLNNKILDGIEEAELTKSISTSLRSLQPGETIALPGGSGRRWMEMIFVVKRVAAAIYSFTVINSTETVKYHPARFEEGETEPRFSGIFTVDSIPDSRLLNSATIVFLARMKLGGCDPHTLYQALIPYLAGSLTANRLKFLEEQTSKIAGPEDWLKPINRRGQLRVEAVAERENLRLLTRFLVADANIMRSSEMARLSAWLIRSLDDASKMSSFSLGDETALRAACRVCAMRCLVVSQVTGKSPKDIPHVVAAQTAADDVLSFLSKSSESLGSSLAVDIESSDVSFAGSAPSSACLFPRWELAADNRELPETLTGISSASVSEEDNIEKAEKAMEKFVDLLLSKPEDEMKITYGHILDTIVEVGNTIKCEISFI